MEKREKHDQIVTFLKQTEFKKYVEGERSGKEEEFKYLQELAWCKLESL